MDILKMLSGYNEDVYYSKEFMDVIESHISYLRSSVKSNTVSVDLSRAAVYEGDLFGFLNEMRIEKKYHWIIMRMNKMYCSTDFNLNVLTLIIPNDNEIEQIRAAHVSTGIIKI